MSQPLVDEKQTGQHVEDGYGAKAGVIGTQYVSGSAEEKKLVRKIDRHLMPMLWVMYIFNYLDRTNIGNAKVGGMQKDLKLTSSDYSLVLSIFFVGYLLNEIPCNMILSRSKPSIFLPLIMVTWVSPHPTDWADVKGAMSTAVAGVNSFGGLIAFRFCLGLVEAGFFPGVMLLLSCWYKPAELSKRIAFFYTASLISGAFGGLLAGGIIDGMQGVGKTAGWKWLFIIEGLATVVIAGVSFFILPNWPATTKWLTDDERILATVRLEIREEVVEDMTHREAFVAAAKDPKTWVFMLIYNVLNSVGTISYFFPTLMTSLGYRGRPAQFMTVPIYVVALIIALAAGWNADRTRQKAWHVVGAAVGSVISFIICVTAKNNAVRYTFICFGGAGIWTAVPIFLSWLVIMFDGREKRAISIAMINGVGNLSSIYGSFFWPAADAPKYVAGFSISTALMALAGVLAVLAKWRYQDRGVGGIPKR